MTDNTVTNNTKTLEAHDAYRANRMEAGRVIDIETCEVAVWDTDLFDPYGIYSGSEIMENCYWARSEDSDGWIVEHDLPPEKRQAMPRQHRRMLNLWYAARALHPSYLVVTETPDFLEDMIKWKGDGAEPSQGALIDWFKVNHPAQAREVRARVDAYYEARRPVAVLTNTTAACGQRGDDAAPPFAGI